MKVTEICSYYVDDTRKSLAYYHTKIEGRNVIFRREMKPEVEPRGSYFLIRLNDAIYIHDFGNNEDLLRKRIQRLIEKQEKNRNDETNIEPIQTQNGRETDLNLANIIIHKTLHSTDDEKSSYQYLLNKKIEELTLDRFGQLKKTIQDNLNFYSLEIYLKKYEEQSGSKLSEIQIQAIRDLNQKIQDDVITGRYNLEDYNTFLQSLPDLLSRKKILGFGYFDREGTFWEHGEIDEPLPSAEDIYDYNTYTYHRFCDGVSSITNDHYKIISSPSIKYRMKNNDGGRQNKLCCIDVMEEGINFFNSETQKIVKGQPNMKLVGESGGIRYSIYDNSSGILFAGGVRQTIKEQPKISAHDIAIDLAEISRKGLTDEAQGHLIELANKKIEEDEKSKKEL